MQTIIVAVFLIISLLPTFAFAVGPVVGSGCKAEWTEPQTNTDGSNLADLKEYRIYVTQTPGLYADPPAKVVPAANADPPANSVVQTACPSGLPQGQNYMTVVSVDLVGNASPRSNEAPFELNTVAPAGATGLKVLP